MRSANGPEFTSKAVHDRLRELFQQSDLFALPSLLEGFGLTYLEALAEGCPVLGTENTGAPDLGDQADGIFSVPSGNVPAIVKALEDVAAGDRGSAWRRRAWETARRHSWKRFRSQLVMELS